MGSALASGRRARLATILLAAWSGRAQELECPSVATAEKLVRCALSRSEVVVRAEREVDASRARSMIAGRVLPANPTLELSGGRRTAETGGSDYDRAIDLAQIFELGGQRGARLAIASREEKLATTALDGLRREITVDVLSAVAAVWRTRTALALARDQRQVADRLVEVSVARQRQGLAPALDVDLAQAAWVQARRDEGIAAQDTAEAEGRLARAVGSDIRLVEGEALPSGFHVVGGLEVLEQQALTRRREVLTARSDADLGRAREESLRRERIPDVTISAGVRHEEFSNVLGARVSVPLPLVRRNQGEIAEQRARVAQADAVVREAELRVRLEVRAAFANWQRATETARQTDPALEDRLREDAAALRDAYARGTMPLPTALASLRETQAARRTLTETKVEAVLASFQLARAAGYAASPDLDAR